jgi:hypothetical protein
MKIYNILSSLNWSRVNVRIRIRPEKIRIPDKKSDFINIKYTIERQEYCDI